MTVMLAVLKVDLESHDRMLAKRNQTALTPLAVGTHDAALEVEVRQRQSHQFTDAKPGSVHHMDHGRIATPLLGLNPGCFEKALHLLNRQRSR